MKRIVTLICITLSLSACQKWLNGGTDPTVGPKAGMFTWTADSLAKYRFSINDIPDEGTISEPIHFYERISLNDWRQIVGIENRISSLDVPEETLKEMTTLALVKSVANFPNNFICSAYNDPLVAIDLFFEYSSLYKELASRKNAPDILIWAFWNIAEDPGYYSENYREYIANRNYEAIEELNMLNPSNYKAFTYLMASDHLDLSKSKYMEFLEAVTASRIGQKGLCLSGSTFYGHWEPLLLIWDKYFSKLPDGVITYAPDKP